MDALKFPSHFPPTDKWNKFFIGVRWLGPDLSFFNELKKLQANRDEFCMVEWGEGARKILAEKIGKILQNQLGWRSAFFIPQDLVKVAFHGPRFDFIDSDSAFEDFIEMLSMDYGLNLPDTFWKAMGEASLGELVDDLLSLITKLNNSFDPTLGSDAS